MAKREWVGEYTLYVKLYLGYSNKWVDYSISLGRCLSWDDAVEKAAIILSRDYTDKLVKPQYIQDGWGNRKNA